MKILVILSILFGTAPISFSADWQPSLTKANEVAKTEKLPILVAFTADWCAPCIRLKRKVLQSEEFATWVKDRFVLVEVKDATSVPEADRKAALEVWQKHKVDSIPTLIVLSTDGKELARSHAIALKDLQEQLAKFKRGQTSDRR